MQMAVKHRSDDPFTLKGLRVVAGLVDVPHLTLHVLGSMRISREPQDDPGRAQTTATYCIVITRAVVLAVSTFSIYRYIYWQYMKIVKSLH